MPNPRTTGLLVLLLGVLVLMGNTLDVLPPEAFFAGLLTYPIGAYLLFMGTRRAGGEGRSTEREVVDRPAGRANPPSERPERAQRSSEQLTLYDVDADEAEEEDITEDLPAPPPPLVAPGQLSVADRLQQLHKLHQQGIITAEELAVAKAKLMD